MQSETTDFAPGAAT